MKNVMAWVVMAAVWAHTACLAQTTYYVSPYGDDTDGLSWATAKTNIQSAVNLALNAGDEVVVTNGTYSVITGTGNRKITIRSVEGAEHTIIDGNGMGRCATLGAYGGDTATVLLGFTLTNGVAPSVSGDGGGGVRCGTLNDCVITGNTAKEGGGANNSVLNRCILTGNTGETGGGAFYCTLTDCTLAGNTASSGGGAFSGTLNDCALTGNSASYGGGASLGTLDNCLLAGNSASEGGGGVRNGTLNNCLLTGNSAGADGGGAYNATLNNCLLTGNTAASYGGGAYYGTLKNCTVAGNKAADGGGVYIGTLRNCIAWGNFRPDGTTPDDLYIGNRAHTCSPGLSGNGNIPDDPQFVDAANGDYRLKSTSPCINAGDDAQAPGAADLADNPRIFGAAVDMGAYEWGYPTLLHVNAARPDDSGNGFSWANAKKTIQAAIATAQVGDTVLVADGTYGAITVTDNRAIAIRSVNGAAHTTINAKGLGRCATLGANSGNTATVLTGFTLTNGVSSQGGGAYCGTLNDCVLSGNSASAGGGACYGTLSNCTLAGNTAAGNGGGAFSSTLNDCTLTGNSATALGGGANGGTLKNCTLTNNTASSHGGGASGGTLNDCTLAGNTANDCGGGAFFGTLNNCTLTGNTAYDGGGAYNGTLNDCTLTNNTATSFGGGASGGALNDCTLTGNSASNGGGAYDSTLSNCTVAGNSANYGGGAYDSTLNNCTLAGNTANGSGGGASYGTLNNCTLTGNSANYGGGAYNGTLKNCTVAGNKANDGGGANNGTLRNCIVWGNFRPDGTTADDVRGSITGIHTCSAGLSPSNGNITQDPQFTDAANGDYRLKPTSPCINAGDNSYAAGIARDLDGNPRILGFTVDMGAYEYPKTHTPSVPVNVEYCWLDLWQQGIADYAGYETLALSGAANGLRFWECYVAGLDPTDKDSRFLIRRIKVEGDDTVTLDWSPDKLPGRTYKVWGKENLADSWGWPTNSASKFFKVSVEM